MLQRVRDGNGWLEDRARSRQSRCSLAAWQNLVPNRFWLLDLYGLATGFNPRTTLFGGWLRVFGFIIHPKAYLCKFFKFGTEWVQAAVIKLISNKTATTQGADGRTRGTCSFVIIDQQAIVCFLAIVFLGTGKCFLKVEKSGKKWIVRDTQWKNVILYHS